MRVFLVIAALALAGCADYPELDGFVAPVDDNGTNSTEAPPQMETETEAPSGFPVLPIASTPYTAPVAIALDRMEGRSATLELIADARGLRCVATPHMDPQAAPVGYKSVGSWARCSIWSNGTELYSATADTVAADLPLMRDIPVEAFAWNMTVGQTLENNSGQHERVVESVDRAQTPGPSVSVSMGMEPHGGMWHDAVCDTILQDGVARLHVRMEGHNGRAVLQVDLQEFDVHHVEASGSPRDGNETADQAVWSFDNGTLHVAGAWAHESVAQATITIRFEGHDRRMHVLAPPDCPGAIYVDQQFVPLDARALGIAAGWQQEGWADGFHVQVWHGP